MRRLKSQMRGEAGNRRRACKSEGPGTCAHRSPEPNRRLPEACRPDRPCAPGAQHETGPSVARYLLNKQTTQPVAGSGPWPPTVSFPVVEVDPPQERKDNKHLPALGTFSTVLSTGRVCARSVLASEVGAASLQIPERRKMRLRKVKKFAQSHTARLWQSWDTNSGSVTTPESMFLNHYGLKT